MPSSATSVPTELSIKISPVNVGQDARAEASAAAAMVAVACEHWLDVEVAVNAGS